MSDASTGGLFRNEARSHGFATMPGSVLVTIPRWLNWTSRLVPLIGIAAAVAISFIQFAAKERVTGVLTPSLGISRITASVAGFVRENRVSPGNRVDGGQVLAVITPDPSRHGGSSVIVEQLAAAERRKFELSSQTVSTKAQHDLEVRKLSGLIAANKLERAALSDQIKIQDEIVLRLARQADVGLELAAKSLISGRDAEQRQNILDDARTRAAELKREMAHLDGTILQARSDLATTERELNLSLSRLKVEALEVDSQIASLRGETSIEIRSPVSGTVDYVAYRSGQVVVEGALLFSVVPQGSDLRAELFVPSLAIARMKVGQPVRIEYDAFPAEFFGYASGSLSSINETLLDSAEARVYGATVSGPVYRLFATLSSQSVEDQQQKVSLKSGMTFAADVVVEKHPLYIWLWRKLTRAAKAL